MPNKQCVESRSRVTSLEKAGPVFKGVVVNSSAAMLGHFGFMLWIIMSLLRSLRQNGLTTARTSYVAAEPQKNGLSFRILSRRRVWKNIINNLKKG